MKWHSMNNLLAGTEPTNLNSIMGSIKKIRILVTTQQPMSYTIWQQVWNRKLAQATASSWQQYRLVLTLGKCGNTPSVWHSPSSQHRHVIIPFRHNPVFLTAQLAAYTKTAFKIKLFYFALVGSYYLQAVSRHSNCAQPSPDTRDEQLTGSAPEPMVHWPGKHRTSLAPAYLHRVRLRLHILPHLLFKSTTAEGRQIATGFELP